MWQVWRPVFGWPYLCPILFADSLGLVVVMPRAHQPVTFDEVKRATPDCYPEPSTEFKAADFGRVGGRVVALDYGIWSADVVKATRADYSRIASQQ